MEPRASLKTLGERLASAIDAWTGGGRRPFAAAMRARGVSGHSYRTIYEYQKGKTDPSPQWIEVAADVLRVSLAWLKEGTGERALESGLRSPDNSVELDERRGWIVQLEQPFHEGLSGPTQAMLNRTAAILASTGEVQFRPGQTLDREPDFMIWLNDYVFALRILRTWIEAQPRSLLPIAVWDLEWFDAHALQSLLTFKQLMSDPREDMSINSIRKNGGIVKDLCRSYSASDIPWFSDPTRKEVTYGEDEEELVQDD